MGLTYGSQQEALCWRADKGYLDNTIKPGVLNDAQLDLLGVRENMVMQNMVPDQSPVTGDLVPYIVNRGL